MNAHDRKRIEEYLRKLNRQLALMKAMWMDPLVQCYNDIQKPRIGEEKELGSIFLAGPTSRSQLIECNWRCEAVQYLRKAGFKGYIYVPEPRGEEKADDFRNRDYIHHWESSRLLNATHAVFWIPRKADELLGLNTNLELGIFIGATMFGRLKPSLFVGWPPEAERMGLPSHYVGELAGCRRFKTLRGLCYAAAGKFELGKTI